VWSETHDKLISKNKKKKEFKNIWNRNPNSKTFRTKIHRSATAPTDLLQWAVFSWLFKFSPSGLGYALIDIILNFEPHFRPFMQRYLNNPFLLGVYSIKRNYWVLTTFQTHRFSDSLIPTRRRWIGSVASVSWQFGCVDVSYIVDSRYSLIWYGNRYMPYRWEYFKL